MPEIAPYRVKSANILHTEINCHTMFFLMNSKQWWTAGNTGGVKFTVQRLRIHYPTSQRYSTIWLLAPVVYVCRCSIAPAAEISAAQPPRCTDDLYVLIMHESTCGTCSSVLTTAVFGFHVLGFHGHGTNGKIEAW